VRQFFSQTQLAQSRLTSQNTSGGNLPLTLLSRHRPVLEALAGTIRAIQYKRNKPQNILDHLIDGGHWTYLEHNGKHGLLVPRSSPCPHLQNNTSEAPDVNLGTIA
jgi:muramidase (phage lysozyme)